MPYRTIIIEDDSMVAAIDRQYVESDRRFQVQKTFKSGGEALTFLKDQETDLIILDYYTPAMTGLEFIDALHRLGKAPSIIMVTSASDADIVRALLSRGVLDYLVKPFEFARFRQAMDKFLQTQNLLSCPQESQPQQQRGDHQKGKQRRDHRPGAQGQRCGDILPDLSGVRQKPHQYAAQKETRYYPPPRFHPHHPSTLCHFPGAYAGRRGQASSPPPLHTVAKR